MSIAFAVLLTILGFDPLLIHGFAAEPFNYLNGQHLSIAFGRTVCKLTKPDVPLVDSIYYRLIF